MVSCFLLAGFTACMPDPLELTTIPEVKPEIVVASQMTSEESMLVFLTRTFGALEQTEEADPEALLQQIAINDATVVLRGARGDDTLVFQENGFYTGHDLRLQAGEEYELLVQSPTYGRVSASTRVLAKVPFQKAKADLYYRHINDTLVQVHFSLLDPSSKNWYMLNVQEVGQEQAVSRLINPEAYTLLFEDGDFDDPSFQAKFDFFPKDFAPGDSVVMSLSSISEEYYLFMERRMKLRLSFLEFLSEPANYPSNVKGGKGFFNLYMPDVWPVVLKPE